MNVKINVFATPKGREVDMEEKGTEIVIGAYTVQLHEKTFLNEDGSKSWNRGAYLKKSGKALVGYKSSKAQFWKPVNFPSSDAVNQLRMNKVKLDCTTHEERH